MNVLGANTLTAQIDQRLKPTSVQQKGGPSNLQTNSRSSEDSFSGAIQKRNSDVEAQKNEAKGSPQVSTTQRQSETKTEDVSQKKSSHKPGRSEGSEKLKAKDNNRSNDVPVDAEQNPFPIVSRAKVQVDFLQKMNGLGVEPKKVVEAFSELSEAELAEPPEQTVDRVIDQMGLDTQSSDKAREFFYDMLAQTAAVDLAVAVDEQNTPVNMEVLTEGELNKRRLDSSIDGMHKDFFAAPDSTAAIVKQNESLAANKRLSQAAATNAYKMQNQVGAGQKPIGPADISNQDLNQVSNSSYLEDSTVTENQVSGQSEFSTEIQKGEASKGLAQPAEAVLSSKAQRARNAYGKMSSNIDSASASENGGFKIVEGMTKVTAGSNELEGFSQNNSEQANSQIKAEAMATAQQANQAETQSFKSGNTEFEVSLETNDNLSQDLKVDEGGGREGESEGDSSLRSFGEIQVKSRAGTPQTNNSFMVSSPQANESDQMANIKEVISQARYMMKEGGGEMRIKLAPEGIGDLTLKVAMEGGKVNVEMITSNHDAKKMMEGGMADLKTSLANLKLELSDVKVDLAGNVSNQLEQDASSDAQQFQQRFLHEFQRENNRNRQEMFGEMGFPGRESSAGERSEDAHRIDIDRHRQSSGSRRLNLVA